MQWVTLNMDPASPFQVRNGPFLIDSFLFALEVLHSMGVAVDYSEEVFALDRWDPRAMKLAYHALKELPAKYMKLLQCIHWCWADGAQNDSHARLATARSLTSALRDRIPPSFRRARCETLKVTLQLFQRSRFHHPKKRSPSQNCEAFRFRCHLSWTTPLWISQVFWEIFSLRRVFAGRIETSFMVLGASSLASLVLLATEARLGNFPWKKRLLVVCWVYRGWNTTQLWGESLKNCPVI